MGKTVYIYFGPRIRHNHTCKKNFIIRREWKPWVKQDTENAFDVAMGAFDGAEICEMVGLFILRKLESELGTAGIGLYRDDGLAALRNCSSREADRTRKKIIKIFQTFNLKITVETNLKSVNFLDVNMDLNTGIHKPYRKPNNPPVYINTGSNHPPTMIKKLRLP